MEPLFAHLEAGIRSFDRSMPEEVNRVLADRVTDIAFAPTQTAAQQLKNEGITENVEIVGNTVVDACFEHLSIAEKQSEVLASLNLKRNEYAVATVHRPRNTDNSDRLERILKGLDSQPIPVVFPVHPRTSAALNQIDFRQEGSLNMVEPLDYLDFLKQLTHARAVLTDSGGIQEEASILEIPCLTVRPNTERPETLQAGVNRLIEPEDVERELASLLRDPAARNRMTGHPHLYGDGNAADKVVSKIEAVITTDPE
jgi:UDP-N-acetylglucosamine 2-epimerase (non-hydrolysing)